MNKQKLKKAFKFVGMKALGAFIFVAVAGTSIWALAAFTEPTDTPGNSVQDFAKNIMGANNVDNAFDSSSVTANSDGSVVERLESLENRVGGIMPTAISAESGSTKSFVEATSYCLNLSSVPDYVVDGSNVNTTYTDWRMPIIAEMTNFVEFTTDTSYLWTNGGYVLTSDAFLIVQLYNGNISTLRTYDGSVEVRCVR